MSETPQRIRVELTGDAADLRAALEGAARSIRGVGDQSRTTSRAMDSSMRDAGSAVERMSFRSRVAIASLTRELKELDRQRAEATVDVDIAQAEAKIELVKRELRDINRQEARASLSGRGILPPNGGGVAGAAGAAENAGGGLSGVLGTLAQVAAVLSPALVGVAGAIGAVGGSAGAAAGGAGAVGGAGLGAFGVGLGSVLALAKPAADQIKKVGDALEKYDAISKLYGGKTAPQVTAAQDKYNATVAVFGAKSTQAQAAHKRLQLAVAEYGSKTAPQVTRAQQELNKVIAENGGEPIKRAAQALADLEHKFSDLTKPGQQSLAQAFATALGAADRLLPAIAKDINANIAAFTGAFDQALKTLEQGGLMSVLDSLSRTFQKSIGPAMDAAAKTLLAFGNIARAAAPYVMQLAHGLDDMAQKFLSATANSRGLRDLIGGLVSQASSWLNLFKDLGLGLIQFFAAGAQAGQGIVDALDRILVRWREWMSTTAGQASLKRFFADSRALMGALLNVIGPLVGAFLTLARHAMPEFTAILNRIKPVAQAIYVVADKIATLFNGRLLSAILAVTAAWKAWGLAAAATTRLVGGSAAAGAAAASGGAVAAGEGAVSGAAVGAGAGAAAGLLSRARGLLKVGGKAAGRFAALDLAINLVDSKGEPIQALVNSAHDLTFGIVPKLNVKTAGQRTNDQLAAFSKQLDDAVKQRNTGAIDKLIGKFKQMADEARAFHAPDVAGQYDQLASSASKSLGKIVQRQKDAATASDQFAANLRGLQLKGSDDFAKLVHDVTFGSAQILRIGGGNTKQTQQLVGDQFDLASQRVKTAMNQQVISVRDGFKLLHQLAAKELGLYGIKAGKVNVVLAKGANGQLRPNQRGGHINEGAPTGDSVPSILERGEYVLNRNAVAKVGKDNLDRLNFGTAPRFQQGGGVGMGGLKPGIAKAVRAVLGHFPGLAITSTTGGKHADGSYHYLGEAADLAGPAGYMLQAAAWIKSHLGAGLTEGIHNPNLSIKFGKTVPPSFWGASTWAGHANHIHLAVAGLLKALGLGAAPSLGRPVLKGPESFQIEAAQGALDRVRSAAQASVDRVAAAVGVGSESGSGAPATGGVSKAQLRRLWVQAGGDPRIANVMAAIALAESGGVTTAHNPSGASGLWQILGQPFPGNVYDPLTNARMAVWKYKHQGFGAWTTYTSGAYRQYLQRGGLVGLQRGGSPGGKPNAKHHKPPRKPLLGGLAGTAFLGVKPGLLFPNEMSPLRALKKAEAITEALMGSRGTLDLAQLRADATDEQQFTTDAQGNQIPDKAGIQQHLAELTGLMKIRDRINIALTTERQIAAEAQKQLRAAIAAAVKKARAIREQIRANVARIKQLKKQLAKAQTSGPAPQILTAQDHYNAIVKVYGPGSKEAKAAHKRLQVAIAQYGGKPGHGDPNRLRAIKQQIGKLETENNRLSGNTMSVGAGGELAKVNAHITGDKSRLSSVTDLLKPSGLNYDIISNQLERGKLASEYKDWAGTTAPAPTSTPGVDIASLLTQYHQDVLANENLQNVDRGVLQGFAPLLQGRLVGSFAHGTTYVPATGLALVHKGEQITPAPDGPYGSQLAQRGAQDVHVVVTVQTVRGEVVKIVRQEVRQGAAGVISQQIGARARVLVAAPGGRGRAG